jgi:hypothetical protein
MYARQVGRGPAHEVGLLARGGNNEHCILSDGAVDGSESNLSVSSPREGQGTLTHGMACDTGGTSGRTTWALSNALMARVRSVEAEAKLDLNGMKDIVVEGQQGLRESNVWAARTMFN